MKITEEDTGAFEQSHPTAKNYGGSYIRELEYKLNAAEEELDMVNEQLAKEPGK